MTGKGIWVIILSLLLSMAKESWAGNNDYEMVTIGRHGDEVLGVFVNDEDNRAATCSKDKTIKIWSIPEGEELLTITGHEGPVNNISFSGDDKKIASCSDDETVRVWDAETGRQLKKFNCQNDQIIGVYYSQGKGSPLIASTSFDKTVKLLDATSGLVVKTYNGHKKATNNVAYSYDGKYIASCSDDKSIRIWKTDSEDDNEYMTLTGHQAPVLTVLYSFDSAKLISADQDGWIFVWKMPEGKLLRKIKAHSRMIQDVSFAGDNKTIVSVSLDNRVKLWDTDTGENLLDYDTGFGMWCVDMVSDASIIVIGGRDGTVRFLRKK